MPPKARDVILTPIGFVADHVEVLDLDVEAHATGRALGVNINASTVGDHPLFGRLLAEVVGAALA
jgi:protoheme ferro-lyase